MSIAVKMEKMCRACLSTDERYSEFVSLFSGGCAASEIPTKMMNISDVTVESQDGLPDLICQKCVFLVKVADRFKQQLRMADRELRKFFDLTDNPEKRIYNCKTDARNDDSEIEELAYNPEYLSDKVKAEMEKVFRRKYKILCDAECEDMSQFLKNLDKKPFFPRRIIKKEIVTKENSDDSLENDISAFDEFNSIENSDSKDDKSDNCPKNESIHPNMSAKDVKLETTNAVAIENPEVENFPEKTKILQEIKTVDDTKILSTKIPNNSQETEAATFLRPETDRNNVQEVVDPNIIVISDTSDDEASKSNEKITQTSKNSSKANDRIPSSKSPRGEKRKFPGAATISLSEFTVGKNPKIHVKKIFHTIPTANTRKIQSKTMPRTYFLCTSCNVRLQSVANVLLHHNEVHSQNKNSLHCRMCDKAFVTKTQLLKHFDEHVETHLFRCSYCPNEFVLKDNLERHVLNHTRKAAIATRKKRSKTSNSILGNEKIFLTKREEFKTKKEEFEKIENDSGKENKITKNS